MAKVVFTKPAKYDLLDIEYYIFTELQNPQATKRIVDGILKVIESLSEYPRRHRMVSDEYLKTKGIRMIPFDNYNIFYYFNAHNNIVYIFRILYSRAEWKNIL